MSCLNIDNDTYSTKREVNRSIIHDNYSKGDVDLIIFNPKKADESIAIEFKVVKVKVQKNDKDKINKIEGIKRGFNQANILQSMGFHKSYLGIIIIEDARDSESKNILFRSSIDKRLNRVYEINQSSMLHNDVGVIFILITQQINKTINNAGLFGVCIDKEAQTNVQSKDLTSRLNRYLIRS